MFKVGDKVRLKESLPSGRKYVFVQVGTTYKVEEVGDAGGLLFKDVHTYHYYWHDDFELVEAALPERRFAVVCISSMNTWEEAEKYAKGSTMPCVIMEAKFNVTPKRVVKIEADVEFKPFS